MRGPLTGATGFLGAHTLSVLLRERAEVTLLLRAGSNPWRIEGLNPTGVIRGDLQDTKNWSEKLHAARPEVVIHAAWGGVRNKFRNDSLQIDQNLLPTIELLRACAEAGCQHFIGLGSQAEYGPLNRKISETDPVQPTTLYGATKLATCLLLQQLCNQLGLRFAWLRVFSTFGPMEDPDWMIPYLIRSLLLGDRPSLTACKQQWDYLYGPDAAEAIWQVARTSEAKGVFNLGSGQVYTLRRIVETIRDMIDPKLPVGFGEVPYRPDQVMHLEADIARLRAATGWAPTTSLEEGLRKTVLWHQSRQEQPS